MSELAAGTHEIVSTMQRVTIYALTDPDSGEVRYVGRTASNPLRRYSQHLIGIDKTTKPWVRGLHAEGKIPVLKILEEGVSAENAGSRERCWIDYYRSQGCSLLNYLHKVKPLRPQPPMILASPGSLQAAFQAHGIRQPIDLARLLGIDRRHAWGILHGKIRLAPRFVLVLHERLSIPLEDLLRATVKPLPARRGRPRKSPPPETTPPPGTQGKRRRRP